MYPALTPYRQGPAGDELTARAFRPLCLAIREEEPAVRVLVARLLLRRLAPRVAALHGDVRGGVAA